MNTMIVTDDFDFSVLSTDCEDKLIVQFNEQDVEKLKAQLVKLFELEERKFCEDNQFYNVEIQFVDQPIENLIEVFRMALQRETLVDPTVLTNINLIISGYNTLDDSMFELPFIFFSDLEQLLDIKLNLSKEIKQFQTQLTFWYLACLKSMCKVEYTYLDKLVDVPNVYHRLLISSGMLTLSQVFAKSNPIDTATLPLVKDAYPVAMEIASCTDLSNQILVDLSQKCAMNE